MPPHCSFGKIFTWLQSESRDKTYVILPASHKYYCKLIDLFVYDVETGACTCYLIET